jgi:peptidoglycan-associated lipoprotein
MRKKLWIILALLLVFPGLMFTSSCAKKAIQSDSAAQEGIASQKSAGTGGQGQLEEERLRAARQKEAAERQKRLTARNSFINDDVYFEYDSSTLTYMAQQKLKVKAAWMRANPGANITIEGHCDERGTNEYNLALGDRRAESAKAFLSDLGISSAKMKTISYGEERPVDTRGSADAWATNRRAHFVIR